MSDIKLPALDDVKNILDFNNLFDAGLSEEDTQYLESLLEKAENLSEEDAKKVKKILLMQLATSKSECFQSELFNAPRKTAQQMLDEEDL